MLTQILFALKAAREHARNARLTRPQLEALQLQKFRALVRHAQARSPYYARLMAQLGIDAETCTPRDFPVLTKRLLMQYFDEIVTDRSITRQKIAEFLTRSTDPLDLLDGRYHVLHTSGTSGEVGYFLYSHTDWARGMAQGIGRRRQTRPKRKRHGRVRGAFYGAVGGHFAGVSMASSAKVGIGKLFLDIGLFEVNDPLPKVIQELNAFQPEFISGYTTALKILAAKQREGALRISPQMIGTGGEAMTVADKAILEEAFGCEASSGYGCTEHLMMGSSTPEGRTMILYDDDLIFEFMEDHSLITNLYNYTLPLIRYRMSDILRPVSNSSASPYIEIESLIGRNELVPMFVNREGAEDFISPHTINEIFVAGVAQFQMQLLNQTSFRFVVCLESALPSEQRARALETLTTRLREILDQKLMDNVQFEIAVVDQIPLNPRTRKFQLVVQAA
jgi:phenylacetate-coenzyme A ligase PaaK-like adenylate-forming protein